jgi:hypothetical protein
MCFWGLTTDNTKWSPGICIGDDQTGKGYALMLLSDPGVGKGPAFLNCGVIWLGNAAAITNNVWYHVACTLVPSAGRDLVIYLNGASNFTQAAISNGNSASGGSLQIACDSYAANHAGTQVVQIADAAIWNVALTASEIWALAYGTVRPYLVRPQSLLGCYTFDNYGAPGQDRSPLKNTAAITGAISFVPGPPRISAAPIINTSLTDPSYVMPPGVMPMVPPPAFVLMPQILW